MNCMAYWHANAEFGGIHPAGGGNRRGGVGRIAAALEDEEPCRAI